jgi:pimeloyl-ACP methyl ester carboxylesterase
MPVRSREQPVIDLLPGRAIVSIEARGWRRSRGLPGPYMLEQLAQDVRNVITDAGLTDYILVGHSAGGKVAQLVAAAPPAGLAELVLVASVPSKPPATTRQARTIDVPVIVIAGENDRLEPEQVLRDNLLPYLAKAELHVIPCTGHLSPLEAPADLARILQTAIAEAKPARGR